MKFGKTMQMMPLVVGITANAYGFNSTNFIFNEDDIRKNLINVDLNTINYSKESNNLVYEPLHLKSRFNQYLKNWVYETRFLSNINGIVKNKNFQNILGMGERAVPFILDDLKYNPTNLVWALNMIYDRKISDGFLTIEDASKQWVKWGVANQII